MGVALFGVRCTVRSLRCEDSGASTLRTAAVEVITCGESLQLRAFFRFPFFARCCGRRDAGYMAERERLFAPATRISALLLCSLRSLPTTGPYYPYACYCEPTSGEKGARLPLEGVFAN